MERGVGRRTQKDRTFGIDVRRAGRFPVQRGQRGVPRSHLSYDLIVFPGVWDWSLQWREQRRGFYTKWEEDMLTVAQALTRAEVGLIRQHQELLKNGRPIEGW